MIRKPAVVLVQVTALIVAGCSVEGPSEKVMPEEFSSASEEKSEPERAPIVDYTVNTGRVEETTSFADAAVEPEAALADAEGDATGEATAEASVAGEEPQLDLAPKEALVEGRRAWESGEYVRAARALKLAIEGDAGGPYEGYLCGLALWKAGRPGEAEPYLVDASWKMPEFVRAPVNLARVRLELDQIAEAEQAIETALAVDDGFGPAHNVHGRILLERGAVDEALEAFSRAAELDGDDPWPLNNAGYALLMRGEHDRAVEQLEQATGRSISQAAIWNNLALARERAGDLPGAVEAAARAAELRDGAGDYQATYDRLAALAPARGAPGDDATVSGAPDDGAAVSGAPDDGAAGDANTVDAITDTQP